MNLTATLAADGYAVTRTAAAPQPGTGPGLFTEGMADFASTLAAGESAAMQAMTGPGDAHVLVQALAQTELAVETAVTIRNKVVEAYQEILRMPV